MQIQRFCLLEAPFSDSFPFGFQKSAAEDSMPLAPGWFEAAWVGRLWASLQRALRMTRCAAAASTRRRSSSESRARRSSSRVRCSTRAVRSCAVTCTRSRSSSRRCSRAARRRQITFRSHNIRGPLVLFCNPNFILLVYSINWNLFLNHFALCRPRVGRASAACGLL